MLRAPLHNQDDDRPNVTFEDEGSTKPFERPSALNAFIGFLSPRAGGQIGMAPGGGGQPKAMLKSHASIMDMAQLDATTSKDINKESSSFGMFIQQRITSPFRHADDHDLLKILKFLQDHGHEEFNATSPLNYAAMKTMDAEQEKKFMEEDVSYFNKLKIRTVFHSRCSRLANETCLNLHVVAELWFVFAELKNKEDELDIDGMKKVQTFKYNAFTERFFDLFSEGDGSITFDNYVLLYACFSVSCPREIKLLACFSAFDTDREGLLTHHDLVVLTQELLKKQDMAAKNDLSEADRKKEERKHKKKMEKLAILREAVSGTPALLRECPVLRIVPLPITCRASFAPLERLRERDKKSYIDLARIFKPTNGVLHVSRDYCQGAC